MAGSNAVVLLGKVPLPGQVKTRLCPPFTRREAAAFYACLLDDAAGEMAAVRGVRRYLFYAPAGEERYFRSGTFSAFHALPQRGRDLGERMALAFEETFGRGSRRVVMVGADCPALSAARVRDAFAELERSAAAVFGPSRDGGFYLIGLSGPAPSLFRDVAWSTPSVLADVTGRCRQAGMTYALLPTESDVDTGEDVAELRRWVRSHARPACPGTRRWLAGHQAPSATGESSRAHRGGQGCVPCRGPRSRFGRRRT